MGRDMIQTGIEALRASIREVRERIVEVIVRMDDIVLQQIPHIRSEYALKIGCWEQALLEAEIAARRARRRLALAQAQANRGETPQMDAIETQLDEELATWMAHAERARMAYERAMAHVTGTRTMNGAEAKEFKRLYHVLMRRLHPDVSSHDEEHEGLFALAQAAYKNGDVGALRSLEVATRHLDAAYEDLEASTDEEALAQELELARIEEGVMRERLAKLEESEEMRLGEQLRNPEWVSARTAELRRAVEAWEREKADCDRKLAVLKGEFDGS